MPSALSNPPLPVHHQLTPTRASLGVFGTNFVYRNAGTDWFHRYLEIWTPIYKHIIADVRWAADRQKRASISYWDVLTWMTGRKRPALFGDPDVPELGLFNRLTSSLGRGRLDEEEIEELSKLESIRYVTSQYRWYDARSKLYADLASLRANPQRMARDKNGDLRMAKSGMFRLFQLYMGDAGGSILGLPWQRLLVLSLLIQIRVDLETYYETGNMRLARCGRRSCRAWFTRLPMGQMQRFCSDVCRATAFRDVSNRAKRKLITPR